MTARRIDAGSPAARGISVRDVPEVTVARLPVYLRALSLLREQTTGTVSSGELAAAARVNPATLRKDLSSLGSYGIRGVGYDVEHLVATISQILGLTQDRPVVIVGVGNLGNALANYDGFVSRGFRICALLDADPARTGRLVAGIRVRPVDELELVVPRFGSCIGVIATPAAAAQEVCERLVAAGVRSILNFAPVALAVPHDVEVRKVDLSTELQILAFHEQHRGTVPAAAGAGR